MRSTEKHILFARHTEGNKSTTRPVAVFANAKSASVHKSQLSTAHASGDVDKVKGLDPKVPLTADGKLFPKTMFAIVAVPYEPSAAVEETKDDTFEM